MAMKPQELTTLVSQALLQIRDSASADMAAGCTFGWITRLRQIEELYMRCVYVLLLSPAEEVPHIFSGDTPNSFDFIYVKVNEAIFVGRGVLKDNQPGLTYGNFGSERESGKTCILGGFLKGSYSTPPAAQTPDSRQNGR